MFGQLRDLPTLQFMRTAEAASNSRFCLMMETNKAVAASARNTDSAHVAILMCTRNGAAFLADQLDSIATQTHRNWSLIVSDDGSTDATNEILRSFGEAHEQKVSVRIGPGRGVSANFLSLATDPTIDGDYFAFSDQDDVWHQEKLHRALMYLVTIPQGVPALYCGRTELMLIAGRSYGFSPLFTCPPSFRNALVQNLGGGNTMIFNRAAKKLLQAIPMCEVVLHDWWLYQLVSAADGAVMYDPRPMVKYRQHQDNLIGSNLGWRARLTRLHMMLKGRYRDWNKINIAALHQVPICLMSSENREVLGFFENARFGPIPKRLAYLKRSSVYRQTLFGNVGLIVASILNKI